MKIAQFIIASILILGGGLWLASSYLVDAGSREPERELISAPVTRETIEMTLKILGEITPSNHVTVRSEVSGRAADVTVKVGDLVSEGDLLVRLDERLLQNEKRRLLIDISTAEQQTAIAERRFQELKILDKDYSRPNEVFYKEAEHKITENEVKRLGMRLEEVEEKLRKVRIVSPIQGTILNVGIKTGQVVAGAEAYSGGTPLVQVADLSRLIVEGKVHQVDVAQLSLGMKGRAESILDSSIGLPCQVLSINPIATEEADGSRSFKIELDLKGQSAHLRPGMTTRVVFPMKKVENALAVPVQAVFEEDDKWVVYKVGPKTQTPQKTVVEVGLVGIEHAQIVQGLKEGDVVYLENPEDENATGPQGELKIEETEKKRRNSRENKDSDRGSRKKSRS